MGVGMLKRFFSFSKCLCLLLALLIAAGGCLAENSNPVFTEIMQNAALVRDAEAYFDSECTEPAFLIETGAECLLVSESDTLALIQIADARVYVERGAVQALEAPAETPMPEETPVPEETPEPTIEGGSIRFFIWANGAFQTAPARAEYKSGESVTAALESLENHSVQIQEGAIVAVDSIVAAFSAIGENGIVDLNAETKSLSLLGLTDDPALFTPARIALANALAAYADKTSPLYQNIVSEFANTTDETANAYISQLNQSDSGETPMGEPALIGGAYQIATGGELRWFSEKAKEIPDVSAVLIGDISIAGENWIPIGNAETPFAGSFDGAGHSVSGLTIQSDENYQALFGYVAKSASICNFSVYGSVESSGDYTAGAVAYSEATLSNIKNFCEIASTGKYVGGVSGCVAKGAKLDSCENGAAVSGGDMTGGLTGSGETESCENSGSVRGESYVGGVSGTAGSVSDCTNTGSVSGGKQYIGGVAGSASAVRNCRNRGDVSVRGAFVSTHDRYEASYAGGVAGSATSAANCENTGDVKSGADGELFVSSAAGVAGKCSGETSDCRNSGTISLNGSYIAGVVGGNGGGSVKRCVNTGSVENRAASGEQTGGVASAGNVDSCVNYASVRGYQSVGGVVGGSASSVVKNSYNLGSVSGTNRTGGVAGVCLSADWCYSAGSVSCKGSAAGMIAGSVSRAENCFYLYSESVYSRAGTALSADELRLCMRNADAYKLNFDTDTQSGYPLLSFQSSGKTVIADSVRLLAGAGKSFSVPVGGEVKGLPKQVQVFAGGLNIVCDAKWTPVGAFDAQTPGDYAFKPSVSLSGCNTGDCANVDMITVSVCPEESLPEITAWRLDESAKTEYFTPYGTTPEDLPDGAWAMIDGAEEFILIEWIAPENFDSTDTETAFTFAAQPAGAFRLSAEAIRITVRIRPMMLISSIRLTDRNNPEAAAFALGELGNFQYTVDIYDNTNAIYLWAEANPDYETEIQYSYKKLDASGNERKGTLRAGKSLNLTGFTNRKDENALTLTATASINGETVVQEYRIVSHVFPTLSELSIVSAGTAAYLIPQFDAQWFEYSTLVPVSATAAEITVKPALDDAVLSANGMAIEKSADGSYRIPVDLSADTANVTITIARGENECAYFVRLGHQQETELTLSLSPENALMYISNEITGRVFPDESGAYRLVRGYDYQYTASLSGYISKSGELTADQEKMTLEIALQPAEENKDIHPDTDSEWSDFRGSEDNNGVTNVPTPVSASDAVLYWANQAGVSYSSDAISSPILVDGYLVCTAKQNIFKIDTVTGEVAQVGDMIRKSAFNITPPTYAAGMIFVALADGYVQAFNASTLESLWVYQDALGGQPDSPITYRSGYIYTGFWNGETNQSNFVCIPVTDEDPSNPTEAKRAAWTYAQKGGFYWAGACVRDRFLLVGTDDGEVGYTSQNGSVLSIEPGSGRLIDCLSGLDADVRCSICYDKTTDRYYFTSKGGYFYSVAVSKDGYFDRDSLKKLDLRGERTNEGKPVEGMSTSTPVVYNGRAYVGVSGVGQFQAYGGHCIAVIDLASWKIAYTCPTKGYPQSSGLLTNAYENTGLVYIYFFENMSPGTLRVIRDCPGQTELLSIYDGSPIDAAEAIFTPRGSQRQYALCSPIVDSYGTIYFKNDSGHMMALGSMISSLEIVDTPRKLLYEEGETFVSDGMQVSAHMANGLTRDVSRYVSFTDAPLTPADTDVTIYFRHVRYNNDAEIIDPPETKVNITVLSHSDMALLTDAVDSIDAIGAVTAESGAAIASAREKYDALTDRLKELVSNYSILTEAEEEYALIERAENEKIDRARRLIDAIEAVTLDSADTLRAAFECYFSLSDSGRKQVASEFARLLEKQAAYENLIEGIDPESAGAMRRISALTEITAESGESLIAARDAYDAIANPARITNLSMLEDGEKRYNALIDASGEAARRVSDLIEAIGEVTLAREKAIRRAREAYDALDEDSAKRVGNYETLVAAEKKLAELQKQREEMAETVAALDALVSEIRQIAPATEDVTSENIALLAPLIHQIDALITPESAAFLTDYAAIAADYRAAIAEVNHSNVALGVSVDALEWNLRLDVSVAVGADADAFASGVSPKRVLKLYRVRVIDMLTGEECANHASMRLNWTIPVPNYNESAYSAVNVACDTSGGIQNVKAAFGAGKIAFETIGDGLIGVVGTKAEMRREDSKKSSGSVLDELKPGSNSSSTVNRRGYSGAQQSVISYYGETIATGEWTYRESVIEPELLATFTDAQVEAYRALSETIEKGENSCFGHLLSEEEFEWIAACYRQSNPLAALVRELNYHTDTGKIEIEYALAEEDHIRAIDEWHEQIQRIVNYCLIQGDEEITAARLYQYLTSTLKFEPTQTDPTDEAATAAQSSEPAAETSQPDSASPSVSPNPSETAEPDLYAAFKPGAFYALMRQIASEGDAAQAYAYLLMQAGVECAQVRGETHRWLILWLNGVGFHADPEQDLANLLDPERERDELGHFGMSDARCAETPFAPIVPEIWTGEAFALPECPEDLPGYGMMETVTDMNSEKVG